jgi:V-type H+-transporting ATPase subunit a
MSIFLKGGKIPEFANITFDITDPECMDELNIKNKGDKISPTMRDDLDWILLSDRKTIEKLHLAIFILFILLIIIMLVPKILIDYYGNKKKSRPNDNLPQNVIEQQNEENQVFQEDLMPQGNQNNEQQKGLSDFIVSAAIETIEFVLGTVSNTASYLRLWALSLAHSQLGQVFFQKTIILIGNVSRTWIVNSLLLVIAFPAFAGVTALVLLFMDLMECFLHTLRLHWVEFQNKFFRADGYEFKPFCFEQNLDLREDDFEKK